MASERLIYIETEGTHLTDRMNDIAAVYNDQVKPYIGKEKEFKIEFSADFVSIRATLRLVELMRQKTKAKITFVNENVQENYELFGGRLR